MATKLFVAISILFAAIHGIASAEDYSSSNFIIRAPIISVGGSQSSSTSFIMTESAGQIITGISSGLNFMQAAGFLYFTPPSYVEPPEPPPSPPPITPPPVVISGGSGPFMAPQVLTGVKLSGRAFPLSKVVVLKDGQIAITTIAGPDSNFNINLSGLSEGNYNFAVYGEDNSGRRSSLFIFPTSITFGAMSEVGGIFISPTIVVDKLEVRRGDNLAIFGKTASIADVTIQVNSEEEIFLKTKSDKDGVYLYNFDTAVLEQGQHLAKSKAASAGEISAYSSSVGFKVGSKSIAAAPKICAVKGDLNNDCRVNLIDFSIAAYWYHRELNNLFKATEAEKLSGDGKVDIKDFSIMAYYWTG